MSTVYTPDPKSIIDQILKLPNAKYLAELVAAGSSSTFSFDNEEDNQKKKLFDWLFTGNYTEGILGRFNEVNDENLIGSIVSTVLLNSKNTELKEKIAQEILQFVKDSEGYEHILDQAKLQVAFGNLWRQHMPPMLWGDSEDYYLAKFLLSGKFDDNVDRALIPYIRDIITLGTPGLTDYIESELQIPDEELLSDLTKFIGNTMYPEKPPEMTIDELLDRLAKYAKPKDLQVLFEHLKGGPPEAPEVPLIK